MKVRQKWPAMRLLCQGLTRPAAIIGNSRTTEMTARKKAVCTLSICADSRRIITLVEVKMKPPLTSHRAPWTLGGRRRSQSCTYIFRQCPFMPGRYSASAAAFVLEQRIGELHAGLHVRQRNRDLAAALIDDGPAAQRHGVFRKADDDPAVLRLLRLDHRHFQQAFDPIELLDAQIARQRQRVLDQ